MAVRTVISRSRERVASDAGSSRGTEAGEDEQVRHKSVREIAMSSITKLLIQGELPICVVTDRPPTFIHSCVPY